MELRFNFAQEYEDYLTNSEFSKLTVDTYLMEIHVFFAWLNREYPTVEIYRVNRKIIDDFLQHELHIGKAISTVNKKVTALKVYFDFLWNKGVIGLDPCAKLKRFEEKNSDTENYLNATDLSLLVDFMKNASIFKDEFTYYRNMALVSLHLWGGLSVSEVCNIHWKDVVWQSSGVLVGVPLGSVRWVELSIEEAFYLRTYFEMLGMNKETFVFQSRKGSKMSPRTVQFIFEGLTRKSGIRLYPQRLRNTFIIQKLKEGLSRDEVANLLGIEQVTLKDSIKKDLYAG